jgi:hypothetical protein
MAKAKQNVLVDELLALLRGGNAHMGFDEAIADFPLEAINRKAPHVNYTFWHLLEHMRIAQRDILDFVRDPDYVSPEYEAFWPPRNAKADEAMWKKTIASFRADLKAAHKMVADPKTDFFSPIAHAKDYTVFREILLIADHNAYHISEILALRRVMGIGPKERW